MPSTPSAKSRSMTAGGSSARRPGRHGPRLPFSTDDGLSALWPAEPRGARVRRVLIRFYSRMGIADKRHYVILHGRSEEHTSELQSLMRLSYAVFCLKKKKITDE